VTAIYPFNRWVWSLAALFFTAVTLLYPLGGVFATTSTGGDKAVFALLFILFGAFSLALWRQAVSPRPIMRLDQNDVECRQGRVSWSEVACVLAVYEASEKWSWSCLVFVLKRDASPRPPANRYFRGRIWRTAYEERQLRKLLPSTSAPVLAVGLSGSRKRAVEAVHRYYTGRFATIPSRALRTEVRRS